MLLLPRAGGATLDTRGATPIPGAGVVYVSYRVSGDWGSLQSTSGVLLSADGKTPAVPAPARVEGTSLAGDGWTVHRAGLDRTPRRRRPQDYQVVRENR